MHRLKHSLNPFWIFFRQPDWQHEWQHEVDATILQAIQQGLASEALDTTYQELFIGPAALSAPPWGSVYLDPESVLLVILY